MAANQGRYSKLSNRDRLGGVGWVGWFAQELLVPTLLLLFSVLG